MVIIVLFVLLFIIAIYRAVLQIIPGFYNYLCLLAIIGVAMWLLSAIVALFARPTLAQRRRIKEAKKKDEEKSWAINLTMNQSIERIKKDIRTLRTEQQQHEAKVRANNVLAENDKNLETVRWIIDQIESRRADSVKEALLLYDDKRRRDSAFELKRLQAQMEIDRQGREALAQATRELNETINRKNYEREMKRIEEKKLEELREINDKLSR